jgi:hypothetical protein
MRNLRITTLRRLCKLCYERKAVLLRRGARPQPAAFVINMQAHYVQNLMDEGLWEYVPKGKSFLKKSFDAAKKHLENAPAWSKGQSSVME